LQQIESAIVDKILVTRRVDTFSLFASLAVGSIGTLSPGLQPVLPGALLAEGRVTFDGLALIAASEMLTLHGGAR
jgi:hypothetical protein